MKTTNTWILAPCSAVTYAALARLLARHKCIGSPTAQNRAISASHASFTTILALYALHAANLNLSPRQAKPTTRDARNRLDDALNPLIQHRSALANAVTAWETGYLVHDTVALIRAASARHNCPNLLSAISHAARDDPAILTHHTVLTVAFLGLQLRTARGRERGILVVLALMLMNGSNPLMHARWWAARKLSHHHHQRSRALDLAYAAAFALARFGSIAYVLQAYGAYHGLGACKAFCDLGLQWQAGTAALTAANAMWWAALIKGIAVRRLQR